MGISNVNTVNKAQLLKLASARKTQQQTTAKFDANGSIFKDAGLIGGHKEVVDKNVSLADLNTKEAIKNLSHSALPQNKKKNEIEDTDHSVSGGKKAISDGRSTTKTVQSQTKTAEKLGGEANKTAASAAKLGSSITNDDKKFENKLKTETKEFEKDNDKLKKIIKESEETQKEVENAQHELDTLLASNSFKVSRNQAGSSDNSSRINELQTLIGSKVSMLQGNGKVIYSLQRSQSRHLTRMNRTNRAYINVQKTNKKNIQSQQKATNSVIDTAQKIEQYSAYAQAGGQALNLLGDVFIALGQGAASTVFGSGVGAALISVGTVMKKVGTVMELVGQYGQTAANITKTAAYCAEGNLMGAMQSCAMAAQSGAAAVKGTTQLKGTFGQINDQAAAAKQNIAAKAEAKEIVKANADKLPEGMSEKQARKYVTADLREQMAEAYKNNKDSMKKMSDLKDFADVHSSSSLIDAQNKFEELKTNDNLAKNFNIKTGENGGHYTEKTNKKGVTTPQTVSDKKINKLVNKEFKNEIKEMKKGLPSTGASFGDTLSKLGSSMTNIGAVFMQNQAMNEMSAASKKRQLAPYQMDARTRRIMQKNQAYRTRASYAF